MSDYRAIYSVGETLRDLLWSGMKADAIITAVITENNLVLEPPFKLFKDVDPDQSQLSIYLYRISEDAASKNLPVEPADEVSTRYPPLCLDLHFLITPLTNSAENNYRLLGKVMKILYDNASIAPDKLKGSLAGSETALRVALESLPADELTKLWGAFLRPYRLSVSYQVKTVAIDSDRERYGPRVRRKKMEVTFMPR